MNDQLLDPYGNRRLNEIFVHKFVIYQSEVFKALLESNLLEQQTNEMVIEENEENVDAFTAMVAILYGKYVPCVEEMSLDHILELLTCLDKYQLEDIEKVIIHLCIQEIEKGNPNFQPTCALWLWHAVCAKGPNRSLKSCIEKHFIRPVWSKEYHSALIVGQKDFQLFISTLDFDSFSIFLDEFCDSVCVMRKVCEDIQKWAQNPSHDSRRTHELISIVLKKTKL